MKRLSRQILKKPVSTLMGILAILMLGFLSVFQLKFSLFPNPSFPALSITVDYPGNDADKIEEIITQPLEEAISGIGGIEEMTSTSESGKARINLEFQKDINLEYKIMEIRERMDIASSLFPREAHKPFVFKYDPDQRPAEIIVLKSEKFDLLQIREIADKEIKLLLEGTDGVSQVLVSGGKQKEILVSCDLDKLTVYGIHPREILKVIQQKNKNSAIGKIEHQGANFTMFLEGKFNRIDDIEDTVIYSSAQSKYLSIRDVAEIKYSYRDEETSSRINSIENVSIYIYKSSLGNILAISREIQKKLNNYQIPNLKYEITYDQATTILNSYKNIILTHFLGLFLIILFFLSLGKNRKYVLIFLLQLFGIPVAFFFVLFLIKKDFDINIATGMFLGLDFYFLTSTVYLETDESSQKKIIFDPGRGKRFLMFLIILSLSLPLFLFNPEAGESAFTIGFSCIAATMSFIFSHQLLSLLLFGTENTKLEIAQDQFSRLISINAKRIH
ncbi:MAG: efflux RND transporter permease subunit, partial [Leptospira sp.]|nr:efflux RND transporter permease subunit [Leptospira sp.]